MLNLTKSGEKLSKIIYQPTIGLEVHVELDTKSKMFCSCPNNPDERHPNMLICPICLGHPGTLPVINQEAVRRVIRTGLALNCQIPEYSKFDRKNYFYPDLPKGYQISQYDAPLCSQGYLEIPSFDENIVADKFQTSNSKSQTNAKLQIPKSKKIRIRRVHLEEDTGKLVHSKGTGYSLVDFNRAGIPLMELVTEPDIDSAKEARKFAEELQLILRYLGVSAADMEKGQMRVEVNISLSRASTKGVLGTKVEIKNLNSFRVVEQAIEYEIKRQAELLNRGEKIVQETRGWFDEATASSHRVASAREVDEATASSHRVASAREDDVKGVTFSQREKEEAHDYRYFPEPDLPPLYFTKEEVSQIRAEITELPHRRRERLKREYQLDEKSTEIFVYNKNLGEYFEKVISELPPKLSQEKLSKLIKLSTNYIITDLQGLLKGASITGKDFRITPENFAEFIILIEEGKISSKIAKMVLEEMFKTGADPSHIIEEKGLVQITDTAEIEKIIKEVISQNQKAVEDYKKGKANAFQFLIGQIMAQSKGKANPQIIRDILNKTLTKMK